MCWRSYQHFVVLITLSSGLVVPCLANDPCSELSPGTCLSDDADDVVPLLQVPRVLQQNLSESSTPVASPPGMAHSRFSVMSLANLYLDLMAATMMAFRQGGNATLKEVPGLHGSAAELSNRHNIAPYQNAAKRRRQGVITRQVVSAVAIIMILMTVTVSIQVLLVEFVISGSCVTPSNLLWAFARSCVAIVALLRFALRTPVRFVTAPLRACMSRCGQLAKAKAIAKPLPAITEVIGFLEFAELCTLCNASHTWRELGDNHCSHKFLMAEMERLQLEEAWQTCQSIEDSVARPQTSSSEKTTARFDCTCNDTNSVKELKSFLCLHMQQSAAREHARELQEHFGALVDIVRFFILVVSWFWFSAEVMDLACVDSATETWGFVKAISSPLIFLFVLECDREHFMAQCLAGLVALALLLDLIHHRYMPLRTTW
eukprot:TRINITY_DN11651_c1_g1_i1.p1 TRINITY_DN11651_c1_g1~~TRINITY_DN11651_c1_g1_i1.p1  ORF type:complete len:431 (-),score=55.18 TRINITY_DN11651_c1_g1_i1:82-1374(-)